MSLTTMSSFDCAQTSSDILTVASRIQERALQLASQRGIRDIAQLELHRQEGILRQEQVTNAEMRRKLLTEVRSRHGIEIELFNIRDQVKASEERIEQDKENAKIRIADASEMEGIWKRTIYDVYAIHQTQQHIYQKSLERRIQNRQHETKRREKKLDFLKNMTTKMDMEETKQAHEAERLWQLAQASDLREESEDEEVSSLAVMIKAALTKRSTLRKATETANEAYAKANLEMTKWEQTACMGSMGRDP